MNRPLFLFITSSILSISIYAQQPHRATPQDRPINPRPPATADSPEFVCPVVIVNSTGLAISFEWSYDDKEWRVSQLEEKSGSNSCVGRRDTDIYVRISTTKEDGRVITKHYKLKNGQRYGFYENDDCDCWDFGLLEPPK